MRSDTFRMAHIFYEFVDSPVCSTASPTEMVVMIGEETSLECKMNSSPQSGVNFTWWAVRRDFSGQVSKSSFAVRFYKLAYYLAGLFVSELLISQEGCSIYSN